MTEEELKKVIATQLEKDHTKLDLSDMDLNDGHAIIITEMLKTTPTLQHLDLKSNDLCATGAKAIAEALKVNQSLKHLNLEGNGIDDAGAEAIAEALQFNSTLQALSLKDNSIKKKGLVAIFKLLKNNSTLQSLDLDENNNGHDTSLGIANELQGNFTLQHLKLVDTISQTEATTVNLEKNYVITQFVTHHNIPKINNIIQRNKDSIATFAHKLNESQNQPDKLTSEELLYLTRCDKQLLAKELTNLKVGNPSSLIEKFLVTKISYINKDENADSSNVSHEEDSSTSDNTDAVLSSGNLHDLTSIEI